MISLKIKGINSLFINELKNNRRGLNNEAKINKKEK